MMMPGWRSPILPVILLLAAAAAPGCLSDCIDLVETGAVEIDRLDRGHVYFSKVCIYQDGEHLVIDGKVKRKYFCPCGICRGRVDIDLVAADGRLLGRYQARTCPGDIPRKGSRESSFCFKRKMTLPEGSAARIRFSPGCCVEAE